MLPGDTTEARLVLRTQQQGQDAEALAAALLLDALAESEAISRTEMEIIDAGIARGNEDFAENRFQPLEAIVADKKQRFGLNL